MSWFNDDGLLVKFGNEKGVATKAGSLNTASYGDLQVVEAVITLASVTANPAIISDVVIFPKKAKIEKVELVAEVGAVTGDAATLNVGLQKLNRSDELDYDGILEDIAASSMNSVNETNTFTVPASGGAGVLVGVHAGNTVPGYLTADVDTGTFSDGRVRVKIFYRQTA